MASYKRLTSTGQITPKGSPAKYLGFEVVATTAVGDISVRRGSLTGEVLSVIAAGTTPAQNRYFPHGILSPEGLFASFAGASGTVFFLFE